MAITDLPPPPSRATPSTFSTLADAFIAALPVFVTEANAQAAALTLNATTDTSSSSVAIGLGAKTFIVTALKSFQPGMFLTIADTAAPSTNGMYGTVTSYSGTTLIMNIVGIIGTGTKTAWTISMSGPVGTIAGAISGTTGTFTELITATGGQIAFPATAVPSADPNTLDDYEEGYHTVTITCTTSGSYTVDANNDQFAYTKIGREVHLQGTIIVTGESSPVGDIKISIPFTAAQLDKTADSITGSAVLYNHGGTIQNCVSAYIQGNNAYLRLETVADNGTEDIINHDHVNSEWVVRIGVSYAA